MEHEMTGWLVRRVALLILVIGAISSAACASRTINQVLADPGRYRDRQVKLSGSVVDSYSVIGNGAYQIEDSTGKLWVVSNSGVPRKGARVSVTGTVREGFSLGSIGDKMKLPPAVSAGIILMESSHKAK
jgi:membrane protein implicated in regulation of membrane protease activity